MEKGHMACLRGDSDQADEHGVDLLTATEAVLTTAPDLQEEEVPTEEGVKGKKRT